MNTLTGVILFLYTRCIRWFPSSFRTEFEEEMCEVFSLALHESRRTGIRSMFMTTIREIRDLPMILFYEHFQTIQDRIWKPFQRTFLRSQTGSPLAVMRRKGMSEFMDTGTLNFHSKPHRILAVVPLFLFGFGIAAISLTRGGPWYSVPLWRLILSIAMGLLPMIVISIGGLIALIRGIPDWGLTWVGCAFMGFLIFVKTLAEELAEVGQRIISEPVEIGIVVVLFLVGVTLLVIVGARGWQRGGLLSIGFSVTFTLTFFWAVTAAPFYRHDLAPLALPFSLLIAAITYLYTQASNPSRWMILMVMGLLNLGSLLAANTVWLEWHQTRGETSSPLPFVIFMFLFLICGPIMGLITKPIKRTLRRA